MPNYWFRVRETGEEFEQSMRISELDEFLTQNPQLEQCAHSPAVSYSAVMPKTDEGFKDVLREIKKKHYGSTINV
jgi:hypothetical protein